MTDRPRRLRLPAIALTWLVVGCGSIGWADDGPVAGSVSHMDRSVLLTQERLGEDGSRSSSANSGFLVRDGDRVFLVTGAEFAVKTGPSLRVSYRTAAGEADSVDLSDVVPAGNRPWSMHATDDVAVAPLRLEDLPADVAERLYDLATPLEEIATDIPERGTPVHLVGFPALKGVQDGMSATVWTCVVTTRLITAKGEWGPVKVFYVAPPAGAGIAGSPVYTLTEAGPRLVGSHSRISMDATGPKFGRVVPAASLRSLIPDR